ncbi:MAG: hypothetical protein Q8R18_02955 [bacterium]|nr:hypothetical protein [bacterium]
MVDEKKILLLLVFVIGAVVFVSFSPGLTGYSILQEKSDESVLVENALPGSTIRAELNLATNTDSLSYGKLLATGEASSWISFISEEYAFFPDMPTEIPIYISIPKDIEEGEYEAKIAVLAVSKDGEKSLLEDQIISYISIHIIVSNKEERNGFALENFTVYTTEQSGNIYFQTEIKNKGNTIEKPEIIFSAYDTEGILVLEKTLTPSFLAYEEKELVSSFAEKLPLGKYYAKLQIGEESKSASFSIVEDNSLKRKGEIVYLENKIKKDNLVHIEVYFKNSGEGIEHATLSGEIFHNDEVVGTFQTEAQNILPGDYGIFKYSYAEALDGAYSLNAEIHSGNIVLAESNTEFYSSNAIRLESNVVIIISLVMLLLLVSHFMLSRRKQ